MGHNNTEHVDDREIKLLAFERAKIVEGFFFFILRIKKIVFHFWQSFNLLSGFQLILCLYLCYFSFRDSVVESLHRQLPISKLWRSKSTIKFCTLLIFFCFSSRHWNCNKQIFFLLSQIFTKFLWLLNLFSYSKRHDNWHSFISDFFLFIFFPLRQNFHWRNHHQLRIHLSVYLAQKRCTQAWNLIRNLLLFFSVLCFLFAFFFSLIISFNFPRVSRLNSSSQHPNAPMIWNRLKWMNFFPCLSTDDSEIRLCEAFLHENSCVSVLVPEGIGSFAASSRQCCWCESSREISCSTFISKLELHGTMEVYIWEVFWSEGLSRTFWTGKDFFFHHRRGRILKATLPKMKVFSFDGLNHFLQSHRNDSEMFVAFLLIGSNQ